MNDNGFETITRILEDISNKFKIPLSTLKLNSKILRDINLLDFGNNLISKPARLTKLGSLILEILSLGSSTEERSSVKRSVGSSNLLLGKQKKLGGDIDGLKRNG